MEYKERGSQLMCIIPISAQCLPDQWEICALSLVAVYKGRLHFLRLFCPPPPTCYGLHLIDDRTFWPLLDPPSPPCCNDLGTQPLKEMHAKIDIVTGFIGIQLESFCQ